MFKKHENKLKSKFKKLLQSTSDFYSSEIGSNEEKAIVYMWNQVMQDSGSVTVVRFRKPANERLGIRVDTSRHNHGDNQHEVVSIIADSLMSRTNIKPNDILLEINGINLQLLTYRQMSAVLNELPAFVQLVFYRSETYDRIDMASTSNLNCSTGESFYEGSVKIIINANKSMPHGLSFMDNKNNTVDWCIVDKIDSSGYFYSDRRVGRLDNIEHINGESTYGLNNKQLMRLISSHCKQPFVISVHKYCHGHSNSLNVTCSSTLRCISEPMSNQKVQPAVSTNGYITRNTLTKSTPNISTKMRPKQLKKLNRAEMQLKQSTPKPQLSSTEDMITLELTIVPNVDMITLELTIVPNVDDLKVYIVNKADKCIIIGFHPNSSLVKKFQIHDELVQINDIYIQNQDSLKIGRILKKLYSTSCEPIKVKVNREQISQFHLIDDDLSYGLISSTTASLTSIESYTPTSAESYLDLQSTSSNNSNNRLVECKFTVVLHKINEKFGLKIINSDGPSIVDIIRDEHHKGNLMEIQSGDLIEKINDIYVRDKERGFVNTLIQSCGNSIKLDLIRHISHQSFSANSLNSPQSQLNNSHLVQSPTSSVVPPIRYFISPPSPPPVQPNQPHNQSNFVQNEIYCL